MRKSSTLGKYRQDAREVKSPSTQAGEFVREEFHHIREGKHGARSTKQAIAIGLSKARRAGVKLPLPKRGKTLAKVRQRAKRDSQAARNGDEYPSLKRSHATKRAFQHEGHRAASLRRRC
jgi:hypothetical protein